MEQEIISEKYCAKNILDLENGDVAAFVTRCVKERSLSSMVCELNAALLSGTPEEQNNARKALQHIGFI
ncbi:hypothetical protein [uncultured Roseobacter sp.]|uniref:hypothetical protein n=1 Tax=uncultured Roseobacter sp. TaxID=114847 RepID=UPI0026150980|nr:hypothetical protein [uncultured Roseobacter sp.]